MRNLIVGIALTGLLMCIYACSPSNTGQLSIPSDDTRNTAFAVTPADGLGTFDAVLEVNEQADGTTVTISAENAEELSAATLELSFDQNRFTPVKVELGNFLGGTDQTISLIKTDIAGKVPIGIAQLPGTAAMPASGSGVLAVVQFSHTPFNPGRVLSASPAGPQNKVNDLAIVGQTADSASLRWTEINTGDYNNNSEVEVGDLTPIAILYGQTSSSTSDPDWFGIVDGDRNGEINAADIQPIAVNYGNQVAGYTVYSNTAGTENIGVGCTCVRNDFFVDQKKPVVYNYDAPFDPAEPATFTVRPVENAAATNPGELSNVAQSVDEPGAPSPPANLNATSSETIGDFKILLGWQLSTSSDVASYEIERKLNSATDWVALTIIGGGYASYVNYDAGFIDEDYDYRVRAVDFSSLTSDWSNVATATPYFPELPPIPTGVTAVPSTTRGLAVDLSWNPVDQSEAPWFKVFGREQGVGSFAQLGITPFDNASYTHEGLSMGVTYEYYIVSNKGALDSMPSATVSSLCSEESDDIFITDLTTTKTTHYADGGDGTPATITVTSNPAFETVSWTSTLGSVSGTGGTVTWSPPAGSDPEVVIITCTVHKGSGQDSRDIEMYLTNDEIQTSLGTNGKYIDFSLPNNEQPSAPYKSFSDYNVTPGTVALLNDWGIW